MINCTAILITGHYFEKYRALANAITVGGSSAGFFIIGQLVIFLLQTYNDDWRLSYRILTGINLLLFVVASVYKPLPPVKLRINNKKAFAGMESDTSQITVSRLKPRYPSLSNILSAYSSRETFESRLIKTNEGPPEGLTETRLRKFCNAAFFCKRKSEDKTIEKVKSRPIYRDDAFYTHNLGLIPEYEQLQKAKSVVDGNDKSTILDSDSLSYHLSVSRVPSIQTIHKRQFIGTILRTLTLLFDPKFFKSITFYFFVAFHIANMLGVYLPTIYLIGDLKTIFIIIFLKIKQKIADRTLECPEFRDNARYYVSALGISNVVGRLSSGTLILCPRFSAAFLGAFALCVSGVSCLLIAFIGNRYFLELMIICAFYGVSSGFVTSLRTVLYVQNFGLANLTNAYGLLSVALGIGSISGPLIVAHIRDKTNSYVGSFIFGGTSLLFSSLFLCVIPFLMTMKVVLLGIFSLQFLSNFECKFDDKNVKKDEFLSLADKIENDFTLGYKNFKKTGYRSEEYEQTISHLSPSSSVFRRNNEMDQMPEEKQDVTCLMCRAVVNTFLDYRRVEHYDDDQLLEEAIDLCLSLNIQPESTCEPIIRMHLPPILYIIDSRPDLTAKNLCGMILQSSNCGFPGPNLDYAIKIDDNLPKIQQQHTSEETHEKTYHVLHLTDIHFDPRYSPGSNALCEEPTCCRSGEPESEEEAAGFYGDYRNCDVPWHTIVRTMQHLNETHKDIDWIYFTGDVVDHGIWETSIDDNIIIMEKIYQLLQETFPNIPIYPILGNHETHPVNVFAPKNISEEELSSRWLYDFISVAWSPWLPSNALTTVKEGGYYSTLIRPKLRVIALNNNDCYVYNWWTFYSTESQTSQLQWLHDTLLAAENRNESVHILTHIYPGEGSCFKVWAREYKRIIERFSHLIKAQFYGHTHYDEFNIFYDSQNQSKPINVGWNGGSLTPYADEVLDYSSWIYNLTKANQNVDIGPQWYKLYSFKDQFNLKSLSLSELDELMHCFATDAQLLTSYWELRIKKGDPFIKMGCDNKCLMLTLCDIVINVTGENSKCNYFTEIAKNCKSDTKF
uniref:CSON003052 protein n=1 Tax=Culicoides sonorensis TaxID=179676 RepID=A0A336MKI9_CULSO